MNELTCLIFSKDRAAQLYALLESFKLKCNCKSLNLTVLYSTSNKEHKQQYDIIQKSFPDTNFIHEKILSLDVKSVLSNCRYIGLFCDDSLILNRFDEDSIIRLLDANNDAIGFSLRLGKNISYCYPFDKHQKQPRFEEGWGVLKFNWMDGEYDWGYPLEVSSSIYRSKDILSILPQNFRANQLEAFLHENRNKVVKPYLFCYEISAAFSVPLNVVNEGIDTNRKKNGLDCSIENMKQKFNCGQKIDISVLNGMTPKGCHEEIEIRWINR